MTSLKVRTVVEIDGQDYDLDDCTWLHFSPCGCLCGVAMARHMPTDPHAVAVELSGTQTEQEAKRDEAAGFTLRLVPMTEYRADWQEKFMVACPHSPTWGIEPDPVPPGMAWAHDTSSAKYRHLVEAERVADTSFDKGATTPRERARFTDGQPLCGKGSKHGMWSNLHGHLTADTMVCLSCVKAANSVCPPLPLVSAGGSL